MHGNFWILVGILITVAGKVTMAEIPADEDLITLAKNKFRNFTSEEEQKVFEQFFQRTQDGETADLDPTNAADTSNLKIPTHAVRADVWGKEPVIRAEWLNWLCNDPHAFTKVTSRGIDLAHAKIIGKVDLSWAKLPFPLRASKCAFTDSIILTSCSLRGLELQDVYIKRLHGEGLSVDGAVHLLRSLAEGPVAFSGSTIQGDLDCSGGQFLDPVAALNCAGAKIGGRILLAEGFEANGDVHLENATVAGDLTCAGGKFRKSLSYALDAEFASIGGSVFLIDGFAAEGIVNFRSGRISHNFVLRNIDVRDEMALDLQYAKVGTLSNENRSWPRYGRLSLYGLVYDFIDFASLPNVRTQLQWLHRQGRDRFFSQPYEQLAATLRSMGFRMQAAQVEKEKKVEEGMYVFREEWNEGRTAEAIFDWYKYYCVLPLVDYGYSPFRPLMLCILVVLTGQLIFRCAYSSGLIIPTKPEEAFATGTELLMESYPRFNALFYSLDTFVPIVSFGIANHWAPSAVRGKALRIGRFLLPGAWVRSYQWLHTILGWIFGVALISTYPDVTNAIKEVVKL